jgi:predicted cupin superfamily sugar epimerase
LTLRMGRARADSAAATGPAEVTEPAEVTKVTLGPDIASGEQPQVVIPGGVWQAAAPAGDEAVLVSCIVAPGFDFADFTLQAP